MMELAANALTTLETVKKILEIPQDDTEYDQRLILLINSSSSWIETMTGRKLGRATYRERYAPSGSQELVLNQWPIINVIEIRDTNNDVIILPESYDYLDAGDTGTIYKDDGWAFKGYRQGLANDFIASMRCLEVHYTAGYVLPGQATEEEPCTLPYDLQSVAWGVVQQEFMVMENGSQELTAFSISDVSWTFDKEPRQSWIDIIDRYRRW